MLKLNLVFIILVSLASIYSIANKVYEPENTDVIQKYLSAYEEADYNKRMVIIDEIWTETSYFKDPVAMASGPVEFNSMIESFRRQIPGLRVESQNHFSTGLYRSWEWSIYNANDQLVVSGYDFAELNEENKIIRVHAFLN